MKKILQSIGLLTLLTLTPITNANTQENPALVNAQCSETSDSCIWEHKDFTMNVVYDCSSEQHSGFLSFSIECDKPYIEAIDKGNNDDIYIEFLVDDIKLQSNFAYGTEVDEGINQEEVLKNLIKKRSFPVFHVTGHSISKKRPLNTAVYIKLVNFDFAEKWIDKKNNDYYDSVIMPKIIGISITLFILVLVLLIGLKISKLKRNE